MAQHRMPTQRSRAHARPRSMLPSAPAPQTAFEADVGPDVVDWSTWLDLDGDPHVPLDEEWPGTFGAAVRGMP